MSRRRKVETAPTVRWFVGKDFGFHVVGGAHDPEQRGHTQGELDDWSIAPYMRKDCCAECQANRGR